MKKEIVGRFFASFECASVSGCGSDDYGNASENVQ